MENATVRGEKLPAGAYLKGRPVGVVVQRSQNPIRCARISFICINHLDLLFGVHAVDGGIGQIGRVAV
jgi:hypothetical protein